jgi:hypothetical protein
MHAFRPHHDFCPRKKPRYQRGGTAHTPAGTGTRTSTTTGIGSRDTRSGRTSTEARNRAANIHVQRSTPPSLVCAQGQLAYQSPSSVPNPHFPPLTHAALTASVQHPQLRALTSDAPYRRTGLCPVDSVPCLTVGGYGSWFYLRIPSA